jgi:repressor LexA
MRDLTKRQAEVLDFISRFTREKGFPPTVRELASHLDLAGPRGAAKHLEALERKGWIRRLPGISRGLEIVQEHPSPTRGNGPVEIPIVGTVAAGPLDLAAEDIEGSLNLHRQLGTEGNFLLRVKGYSMSGDSILPGDLALVRPGARIGDGDLVVVVVGDEATLKRYRREKDRVVLEASNPEYPPVILTGKEPEAARVAGRVEAIIRLTSGRDRR